MSFLFTEADFLEAVSNMNTASKYHKVRSDAWSKIHELVGKEIDMSNKKDGSMKWKVVPGVFDDVFKKRREQDPLIGDQE